MPAALDSAENRLQLVDFDVPSRAKPTSHPGVDSPLCEHCVSLKLTFFDPSCSGCSDILHDPKTTISEIFAIIRQWVPQTQQNFSLFAMEILRRGAHVNDRDGLTDMTLLHYASKSGAAGVGDVQAACQVIGLLIKQGADVSQKCRWTDMLPLHYACFFDIAEAAEVLLESSSDSDINSKCKEFNDGCALHIACSNLCLKTVQVLVKHGADVAMKDNNNRTPSQCIAEGQLPTESQETTDSLRALLETYANNNSPSHRQSLDSETMYALGLEIGDTVSAAGNVGRLSYCGGTDFASGQWAGVELAKPHGKNDGSVAGVVYFQCKPNHGLFVPLSRVKKVQQEDRRLQHAIDTISTPSSTGSESGSRVSDDRSVNSKRNDVQCQFQVGQRVLVSGHKPGAIRFVGKTEFAAGLWIGVELDDAAGKNDGSVAGVRYFSCSPSHGVFAPPSKINSIILPDDERPQSRSTSTPSGATGQSSNPSDDSLEQSSAPSEGSGNGYHSDNAHGEDSPSNGGSRIPVRKEPQGKLASSEKGTITPNRDIGHSSSDLHLKEGMSVYWNNELGIVRFIGHVKFAGGVWLGVELRKPSGKNDGSVDGVRYFTCKPNFGIMVRPSRATCRGINCSKLITPTT